MRKLLAFLKYYWFGLLMSFILLMGFMLFLLILVSPKHDMQKRGFIPCTETLVQNLQTCPKDNKYSCGIKHVLANSWCNIKVIGKGWQYWWQGKQTTPWANYIFEPEILKTTDENDEFYAEYKEKGITPELDMQNLIKMSDELDKHIATIKEDKTTKEEKKDGQEK